VKYILRHTKLKISQSGPQPLLRILAKACHSID
jgi:hypothetical protein